MKILVHDFLRDCARRFPERLSLSDGPTQLSFGALERDSLAVARGLQELGLRRGDRVAIFLENSIEAVVALFGVLFAGGVFVMVNATTKASKLRYLLRDCGARALISRSGLTGTCAAALDGETSCRLIMTTRNPDRDGTTQSLAEMIADTPPRPADPGLIDQDLCMIMYTSGSTGDAKGVMLTHRNMTNTAWAISSYLGNTADDVVLCVLPLSFDYGLYQVITGARVGFRVVLEKSFAFPYRTLELMVQERVTGLPGVPTIFATLLQMEAFARAELSSLRYLTNTGAAFPPAHIRRLRELLPHARIFSMYGLTECTRVSYLDPDLIDNRIDSVGQAMPNEEVYLVDEQGRRQPPGGMGQLVVRGANVMRGYWGKPEATAAALRDGEIPGEKVLHTGDWFRMDEEGYLYFLGRSDDVFKCKGEKVSPHEIEAVLYELEGVAEAAVIGVPDPLDGQAVKAFVVPRDGATLDPPRVRMHCRERLESRLVPKYVDIRTVLPKTESGKIRKAALVEAVPARGEGIQWCAASPAS